MMKQYLCGNIVNKTLTGVCRIFNAGVRVLTFLDAPDWLE